MAFILNNTPFGELGVQLGTEEIVRVLGFGPVWTKIRVGIRYHYNGYFVTSAYGLQVGICTNGYATWDVANNISSIYAYSTNNQFTFGAGPMPYITTSSSFQTLYYQQVGGDSANTGGSGSYPAYKASVSSAYRTVFMVDFYKTSSTTLQVQAWVHNAVADISRNAYLLCVENEAAAGGLSACSARNAVPPLRATQDWNSIFVTWLRSTPAATIYDITVARFQ